MNLILIGPPGCGKGTQAQIISDKYNYLKVSTGDMLREEIKKDTEIGKKIINNMNDGKFVEDEIVNKLLEKIIFDSKKKNKLIFDGYPRTLNQAKNLDIMLKKSNQKIDYIFFLNVHKDAIIKRIQLRFKKSKVNGDRWKMINQKLLKQRHVIKEMKPLLIRRVIDYGVGYKNDWETLGIPKDYDEGFWNVADLSNYLGPNIKLIYFKSYRHLGDSRGNLVIEILNRVLSTLFKRYGTNFIAVWEKC